MTLSLAATTVLARAAERPDRRLQFHRKLPTGGRHKMIDALLRDGLIVETQGDYRLGGGSTLIEDSATGLLLTTLALTDAGLRTIGQEPPAAGADVAEPDCSGIEASVPDTACTGADGVDQEQEAAEDDDAPTGAQEPATTKRTADLRTAAAAVLAAWDACPAQDATDNPITRAIETMRAALAGKPARPARDATAQRPARAGSKLETVLAMLRAEGGTTIAQIIDATEWQQHTVRGFFAGLKKKGHNVTSTKSAEKGGQTIYRIFA